MLADVSSESLAESVVTGQNTKTAFDFSLMHLKRRSVVWAEKATLDVQNRTDFRKSAWKHVSWESHEDVARLVTQAQVMHDANQLLISHADHPADAPVAGCDTIDEQTICELDEEEEPEEEEDEGAAAPSSSSVAPPMGAAIKHKCTMDKFHGYAHRLWRRAQELNAWMPVPLPIPALDGVTCPEGLHPRTNAVYGSQSVQSKGTLNCHDDSSLTRAPKFCWTHLQRVLSSSSSLYTGPDTERIDRSTALS